MIENKKIQYKLGEDGTAKSFILEVTWTDEYPEVLPEISLDAFYNKHLIPSVKEQILEFAKSEAEQYLGKDLWIYRHNTQIAKYIVGGTQKPFFPMHIKAEGMAQSDIFHIFVENSVNLELCFFWALLKPAKI